MESGDHGARYIIRRLVVLVLATQTHVKSNRTDGENERELYSSGLDP